MLGGGGKRGKGEGFIWLWGEQEGWEKVGFSGGGVGVMVVEIQSKLSLCHFNRPSPMTHSPPPER